MTKSEWQAFKKKHKMPEVIERPLDDAVSEWKLHKMLGLISRRPPHLPLGSEPKEKRTGVSPQENPQMGFDIFGKVVGK